MEETIRRPAVAGTFYPADQVELETTVRDLLAGAARAERGGRPVLFIVPHAGYVYSGPIAATAYRLFRQWADSYGRVLLIGPAHFVGFRGVALPQAVAFTTPLGNVAVDEPLTALCSRLPGVIRHARAHEQEHSLEVQLPFLQIVAPGVPVLPLLTGDDDPSIAEAAVDAVLQVPDVAVIVSSDLSHYLDYDTARRWDLRTAEAVRRLDPGSVDPGAACGRTGILAALAVARRRGWSCRTIDLRNSGDTAGDRFQVVGYGAFALGPEAD